MSLASILVPGGGVAQRLGNYEPAAAARHGRGRRRRHRRRAPPHGRGRHRRRQELRLPRPRHPGGRCADKELPRRRLDPHHQPARTAHPQGHPVPADGDAAASSGRPGQGPRQLPQPAPAARRPAAQSDSLLDRRPRPSSSCVQIGHWSRQTARRQPQRPAVPAAARASGTWSRATAATAWAGSARTTTTASTSRPARQMHGANLLVVNHALFFSDLALRRAGGGAAAGLPGRHLRRGAHARRRGRRPPRPAGQPRPGRVPAQQAAHNAARRRAACSALTATATAICDQVERRAQAAERFFQPCSPGIATSGRGRPRRRPRDTRARPPARTSCPTRCPRNCASSPAPSTRSRENARTDEEKIELDAAGRPLPATWPTSLEAVARPGARRAGLLGRGRPAARRRGSAWPAPRSTSARRCRSSCTTRCRRVVLTSATLSAGGTRRASATSSSGSAWTRPTTLQLGSPFDYREQAELHLFRTMPDPSAAPAKFEEAVPGQDPRVRRSGRSGRAFVLFTSYRRSCRRRRRGCAAVVRDAGLPAAEPGRRPAARRRCSSSSAQAGNAVLLRRRQLLAGRGRAGRGAVERHHHQAAVRRAGPAADRGPDRGDPGGRRQAIRGAAGLPSTTLVLLSSQLSASRRRPSSTAWTSERRDGRRHHRDQRRPHRRARHRRVQGRSGNCRSAHRGQRDHAPPRRHRHDQARL